MTDKKLRVSMTIESVKAYNKTKLEVQLPDTEFGWDLRLTEDQQAELQKSLTKRIEDNKPWKHIVYEKVWAKMKPKPLKTEPFVPSMVRDLPDVIEAMAEELIKAMELDKVKVKQKQIEMP